LEKKDARAEPYRTASETTTQTPLTTQITPDSTLSEKIDYVLGLLRERPEGVSKNDLIRDTGLKENELDGVLGILHRDKTAFKNPIGNWKATV